MERNNFMSDKQKKLGIKNRIMKKYLIYKSDIEEEIGIQQIHEFIEVSCFRKILKIIKMIFIIVGVISGFMTVYSFFTLSDDSAAMTYYQKGMNYLDDNYFEDAEKNFEIAYKKNSTLPHLIYYYAYTEYVLEKSDKSYKILQENKNNLDENEISFLAMFEYRKQNYKKSAQYINKVQKPENLEAFAFCKYIEIVIKLGFLDNYNEGINEFFNSLILLDAKINVAQILPEKRIDFYSVNGIKPDEKYLQKTIDRIINNRDNDISNYKRIKLCIYLLFFYYSIQYDNIEIPIKYFSDVAESIDCANNADVSKQLLIILYIYASKLEMRPEPPNEMLEAYKILVRKYHELELLENVEIEEETKKLFECFEVIARDIDNNRFNPRKYKFEYKTDNPDYKGDNVLEVWTKTVEYMVDYEGL